MCRIMRVGGLRERGILLFDAGSARVAGQEIAFFTLKNRENKLLSSECDAGSRILPSDCTSSER